MKLHYHTLDVFTKERFGGNPLAVVLDADMLPCALMQTIAREFNLSETVFVLKPKLPSHTARIRIFTPKTELAFAGHPTIGTAALLARLRTTSVNGERDAIMLLELEVGPVRVGVSLRDGAAAHGEFSAPQMPKDVGEAPSNDTIAAALGLIPAEIGCENHIPLRLDAGNSFLFVPVSSREVLAKARPVSPYFEKVIGSDIGAYVYCHQPVHTTSSFQARLFAPHNGVIEDPATGSAAAAFAGIVHRFDSPPDGLHKRVIEQGFQINRESYINLGIVIKKGDISAVRIGGDAVHISSGTLEV